MISDCLKYRRASERGVSIGGPQARQKYSGRWEYDGGVK